MSDQATMDAVNELDHPDDLQKLLAAYWLLFDTQKSLDTGNDGKYSTES